MTSERKHNFPLHLMSVLTAAATFPLIFIGGLVTSHGAGLAVPDWPNSYGYNMFLFPPSQWVGNIWYEHVHRLYASFIGLLCIVLCVWAWRTGARRSVRWLTVGLLGLVIFQGVLGGLRVVLVNLDLAIIHGCTAQAFFCLAALTALVTSRWWADAPNLSAAKDAAAGRRVVRVAIVAVVVVYSQLVVGAVMRHNQAGLDIPDFPLSYGQVLPPTNDARLVEAISKQMSPSVRRDAYLLGVCQADKGAHLLLLVSRDGNIQAWFNVTLGSVWLHFGHRVGALLVTIVLLTLATNIFRLHRGRPDLLMPALLLVGLLLAQLTLGALTVLLRKPADVASAHVAVGALVLMTTFVIAARSMRLYLPQWRSAPRGAFPVLPRLAAAEASDRRAASPAWSA